MHQCCHRLPVSIFRPASPVELNLAARCTTDVRAIGRCPFWNCAHPKSGKCCRTGGSHRRPSLLRHTRPHMISVRLVTWQVPCGWNTRKMLGLDGKSVAARSVTNPCHVTFQEIQVHDTLTDRLSRSRGFASLTAHHGEGKEWNGLEIFPSKTLHGRPILRSATCSTSTLQYPENHGQPPTLQWRHSSRN